jgi:hypothetical protein
VIARRTSFSKTNQSTPLYRVTPQAGGIATSRRRPPSSVAFGIIAFRDYDLAPIPNQLLNLVFIHRCGLDRGSPVSPLRISYSRLLM